MKLTVMTLNCWGLPSNTPILYSDHKNERIQAIAEYIIECGFNVVFLQEIWLKADYSSLKSRLQHALPHSVWFNTGLIGSGTCIFSQYQLSNKTFHKYTINGFPHQVWYGDGLAESGLGMVDINVRNIRITLAVTHFHAEYDLAKKPFLADRTMQALELREQLRIRSNIDAILLAGDFNSGPRSLPYAVIQSSMSDTVAPGHHTPTWSHPNNSFKETNEDPITLDYIFYTSKSDCLKNIRTTVPLVRVPGLDCSLSDHQPIQAEFELKPQKNDEEPSLDIHEEEPNDLNLVSAVLQQSITQHEKVLKLFYDVLALLSFCLCFHGLRFGIPDYSYFYSPLVLATVLYYSREINGLSALLFIKFFIDLTIGQCIAMYDIINFIAVFSLAIFVNLYFVKHLEQRKLILNCWETKIQHKELLHWRL